MEQVVQPGKRGRRVRLDLVVLFTPPPVEPVQPDRVLQISFK